jgi:hypothetical protein
MEEIPAFSIWETFNETIPALMSTKPSEKSLEHLAKIIKSGDFSNIFVYNRDPAISFDDYERVANKYKSFTTWFLGRFFYLLSCEKLSKSHNIYVDIQLCVLDQLSNTQLHVYDEMTKEYSQALHGLTKFIESRRDSLLLDVFVPIKYTDLNQKLNLDPVSIEISRKNWQSFLLNLFKFIKCILSQNFDFQTFDSVTSRNLDDLLFLLSECPFTVKLEILKIYAELATKMDDCDVAIKYKMDLFASFFEQIVYEVYNEKFPVKSNEFEQFELLTLQFLELNLSNEKFLKISEFLLTTNLNKMPSEKMQKFCKRHRTRPLYRAEDFESFVSCGLIDYDTSVLCGLKSQIVDDVHDVQLSQEGGHFRIYHADSTKWKVFYRILLQSWDNTSCKECCKITQFLEFMIALTTLLIEIRIEMNRPFNIIFVEGNIFFTKTLSLLNQHFNSCDKTIDFALIYQLFLNLSFICDPPNFTTCFDIFAFVFTQTHLSQEDYLETVDYRQYKKELNDFCTFSTRFLTTKDTAFEYLNKFVAQISSGLFELSQLHDMEVTFMNICSQRKNQKTIINNLPNILTLFNNTDRIISEILLPALSSTADDILKEVTRVLPHVICTSAADFIKVVQVDPERGLTVEIFCDKCHLNVQPKSTEKEKKIEEFTRKFTRGVITVNFTKLDLDMSTLTGAVLKSVLKFLTFSDSELKMAALEVLPFCTNHILKFYSGNVARIWVEKSGDQEEVVRRKFGEIIPKVVKCGQENKILSEETKSEVIEVLFASLTKLTKRSLQQSDYKLQETILYTVQEICGTKCDNTVLPIVKILIYLIMVPTSKHSLIAVNKFFKLAETHNTTTTQIYKLYKQEICEIIAHLCVINQSLVDSSLTTSLCKISVTLEFYSSKDFVMRECQHLLPFFVSKVIKAPVVGKLIEQMALMVNSGVSALLARLYGSIFLTVFLNGTKDDFKCCTMYLEKNTGLSHSDLCKRNLWVILNELLLNFHEKKDKVVLALRYLASEDNQQKSENVQEYLQSRLLGILQHFDFKLMAKNTNRKNSILLSLADLLTYMGPKYVGPLRFKIIAMLRTADCGDFPELSCEVWRAFIKSCHVESLAPQLATIFVSILPLIKSCPKQINDIFKYLVVTNEDVTKESIKDLFFIDDPKIDACVVQVIKKHLRTFDDCSLRDKMKAYLRYLTHETSEVRIRSLKQLKLLIERNREELDGMILGYNGIDPVIVELIEILTLGCREKDPALKLACGEVIGELGAVEPSHLPRRYAQDGRNFTFFINDDAFILSALNELTKALQGEKNTVVS